ncbi:MAG TPA: ATP-binding protein [Epulopiscium sp.]|nr:ATP-binding protein [Candidatus Epulonipiscium sp.]
MDEMRECVQKFISKGREGGYWDFKKQWHDNKAELLLDIICMANNMEDRDAYIIFGIEDKSMKIVGVENDLNRKNLNDLSQFVGGKDFAVYTPEVDLQTIEIEGHDIDVIIIRNTNKAPYYLEKDFLDKDKRIDYGKIYVRINDRKAGTDKVAPYTCIKHLWKKRFGINLSIMERLLILLSDNEKWQCDWGNKRYVFHDDFPEFQLVINGEMEDGWDKAKELQDGIVQDEREIRELKSRKLDIDEIITILENTGKVIKLLDKEAQQNFIRKLISSIKVEDKHMKEIHFTFGNVLGLEEEEGTVS